MTNLDPAHPPTIISVDFETLSLDSDAVVIGFSAVTFQPGGEIKPLLTAFPINAQGQLGRRADPDTVNWWSVRPEPALRLAYHRAMCGDGPPLHAVMTKFLELVAELGENVWLLFKHATFDGALLCHACRWSGLSEQLKRAFGSASQQRMLDVASLRFAAAWAGVEVPDFVRPTVEHHPQLDAEAQARDGDAILTALRGAVNGGTVAGSDDGSAEPAEHEEIRRTRLGLFKVGTRQGIAAAVDRLLGGATDMDMLAFLGRFARNVIHVMGIENVVDGGVLLAQAETAYRRRNFAEPDLRHFLTAVKRLLDVPPEVRRRAHDAALHEDTNP